MEAEIVQKWRILYTTHPTIKQAVTKTKSLKEGSASKSHYVIVEGKDLTDCLSKAKAECKFKDKQLLGMRRM
jgi:hypothetical protein